MMVIFSSIGMVPNQVAAAEYFDITQYNINMEVMEDHSYAIHEDIMLTFKEARHGIFRTHSF